MSTYRTQNIFSPEALARLNELVSGASKVVITCHKGPDGDAIGSSLALAQMLTSMGLHAKVIIPDQAPKSLEFLPHFKSAEAYSCNTLSCDKFIADADLLFCLDYNAYYRLDKMSAAVEKCDAHRVLIDHHHDPHIDADVVFSFPDMSSTCELLYRVAEHAGWLRHLNLDGATCLLTGMMTDTGNFTYKNYEPEIYAIVADLIERGVDRHRIYELALNTFSAESLRICGYAISQKMVLYPQHGLALITLSSDELEAYNYRKGDTEGLVNRPLSIPGIVYSVYMRQDTPEEIKVSMRSKGDLPVNEICTRYFGGGGHQNAAGGELKGYTIDQAVELLMSTLDFSDQYLKNFDLDIKY